MWTNCEKVRNCSSMCPYTFNGGKSSFKCFLRVNYLWGGKTKYGVQDAQEAERQAGDVHLRGLPLQRVREVFHYREAGGHLRGVPLERGRQAGDAHLTRGTPTNNQVHLWPASPHGRQLPGNNNKHRDDFRHHNNNNKRLNLAIIVCISVIIVWSWPKKFEFQIPPHGAMMTHGEFLAYRCLHRDLYAATLFNILWCWSTSEYKVWMILQQWLDLINCQWASKYKVGASGCVQARQHLAKWPWRSIRLRCCDRLCFSVLFFSNW